MDARVFARRALVASALFTLAATAKPAGATEAACEPTRGDDARVRGDLRARDDAMTEARRLAAAGDYGGARAIYRALRERDPRDDEALAGIARVDAWAGCLALAEAEYAAVLDAHGDDADARAGLSDVLVWQGRVDEGQALIAEGLARSPASPPLLLRRARLAYFRGDARAAIADADRAEQQAPSDDDLRALRDRMFHGEARVTGRADRYPGAYPSLYTVTGQLLQRVGLYELHGGAQIVQRAAPAGATSVTDGRYFAGLGYHVSRRVAIGAELSAGAPALAIPDAAAKAWTSVGVAPRLTTGLAYSFWHFRNGSRVHVANPTVSFAIRDGVHADGRAWLSYVELDTGTSKGAAAVGPQVGWRVAPRTDLGIWYTYGAQLDQNPALFQILTFRSHVVGSYADFLLDRHFGVRPVASVERRDGPNDAIWIVSLEAGAYARW